MVLVAYRHRLSGGQIGSIRPTSSHHFSLIFLASAANPSFRSAARRTVTSKFISLLPRPLGPPFDNRKGILGQAQAPLRVAPGFYLLRAATAGPLKSLKCQYGAGLLPEACHEGA